MKDQDLSTRKMLLTMLKTKGSLSVSEMAKELGITEMAVRRHLNTLERDGYVHSTLMRQAMGRPSNLYALTELADTLFPKNYHTLTLELLGELEATHGRDAVHGLFDGRKEKAKEKLEKQMEGKDLEERVSALTHMQNQSGYMAEWEKLEDGSYALKEYNCPISQIANEYEHACSCELELFKKVLGTEVERKECLAKDGGKCHYVIKAAPADQGSASE